MERVKEMFILDRDESLSNYDTGLVLVLEDGRVLYGCSDSPLVSFSEASKEKLLKLRTSKKEDTDNE